MTPDEAMELAEAAFLRQWRVSQADTTQAIGPVLDSSTSMPWPCSKNTIKRHAAEFAHRGRAAGCVNAVPAPLDATDERLAVQTVATEHLRGFWWFDLKAGRQFFGLRVWMR